MAICPECHEQKEFWAPRCTHCNQSIGFVYQCYAQWVYHGTHLLIFLFVAGSILKGTILWAWLFAWIILIGIPMIFFVMFYKL